MACPSCGCKVHYQFNSEDDFAGDDERLERCAACGAVFDIEDSADEDENEPFREVHVTFKRHEIVATQDQIGRDWYIRVTAPSGSYAYDGWWRDSAGKTVDEVLEEAKQGAMLTPAPQ
jgi:predicted RNase H-like HicB family nuclease